MRKRVHSIAVLTLALASISIATIVAAQKAGSRGAPPSRQSRGSVTARRGARKPAAAEPQRIRPADPNRAPQKLVDDALYTNEEFFGANASVTRPYSDALQRISSLINQYPKDASLRIEASTLAESLGQYDRASSEMV